jgi:hypothetical protein
MQRDFHGKHTGLNTEKRATDRLLNDARIANEEVKELHVRQQANHVRSAARVPCA